MSIWIEKNCYILCSRRTPALGRATTAKAGTNVFYYIISSGEFIKVKKLLGTILVCALLCSAVLSATGCGKSDDKNNVSDSNMSSDVSDESGDVVKAGNEFAKDDAAVTVKDFGDVSLGMAKDKIKAVMGEPKDMEQDDILGEIWHYGDGYCDVYFDDDVVNSISFSTFSNEKVSLKTTGLHVGSTFDEVISSFYDNGKKEKIDFVSEIKDRNLGDDLLKQYENIDAYYLYGNLFDEGVASCGYVIHMPSDGVKDEYDCAVYNYIDFDEGSDSSGYLYTLSLDMYTDDDGTDRVGYINIERQYIDE